MSEPATDLVDLSGVVRFRGHFVPPVGGALSLKRELVVGDAVAIDAQALGSLPWTTHDSGDVTIDRTNPLLPVAVLTGLYLVTVSIEPDTNEPFCGQLLLEAGAFTGFTEGIGSSVVTLNNKGALSLSVACPMTPGQPLEARVITSVTGAGNYMIKAATIAVLEA